MAHCSFSCFCRWSLAITPRFQSEGLVVNEVEHLPQKDVQISRTDRGRYRNERQFKNLASSNSEH